MSDDLMKRLRDLGDRAEYMPHMHHVAADRIEELEAKLNWVIVERDETFALMLDRAQTAEAKLSKSEALLAKAVDELQEIASLGRCDFSKVRVTLAELKGEK